MKAKIQDLTSKIPSRQFLEIIFLGLISGMPFSILYTALTIWLKENNHILSAISTIAIARTPYAFKYLWAPIIDRMEIPFLYRLGKRKSWMLLTSLINCFVLVFLSFIDPVNDFNLIYFVAIILGFSSASFDIAFDAYRIDTVDPNKQGYAVSCAILGYRIGMLVVSAGSLSLAHFYGWSSSFILLALIFALGTIYIPLLKEGSVKEKEILTLLEKIQESVIKPFEDFLKRKNSLLILLAIILYKVGDVLLGFMSNPFYLELGYSKIDIASAAKFFGFFATIFGTFLGAWIIEKLGNLKGLIICGLIQAFVNSIFLWLHYAGVAWHNLLITITVENIGAGAGSVALASYLSVLCNRSYSATQYALLSSFAVFLNSTISIKAGKMVENFGWDYFFILTVILSFPALIIFYYLERKQDS